MKYLISEMVGLALSMALLLGTSIPVQAQASITTAAGIAVDGPDEFVKKISNDILNQIKTDSALKSGDITKINALVDAKVLPHVNLSRMTAQTMGRYWRTATPEQKLQMQEEFKTFL